MKNLLEKFQVAKIFEDLKSDKKKLIFVVLAGAIFLFVDFRFLLNGQISILKRTSPEITRLKADLDKLSLDYARMQDLKNKKPDPVKVTLKVKRIISLEEIASFLQEVSDLAAKNDCKITKMQALKEAPGSKSDKLARDEVKATPLLISLEMFSAYHNLGKFLSDLEKAQTFVGVQNLKIVSQTTDYLKQKVSLDLKTYVKK